MRNFSADEEDAEEEEGKDNFDKNLIPQVVVCLDAEDSFLRERIMNLPENVVAGTHNTEEDFLRRLTLFRDINTDDETVLNFFDEVEIHPEKIGTPVDLKDIRTKPLYSLRFSCCI